MRHMMLAAAAVAAIVASTGLEAETGQNQDDMYHQRGSVVCLSGVGMRAVLTGKTRLMAKTFIGAFYTEGSVPMELWTSKDGGWALVANFDSGHACLREIGVKWSAVKGGEIDDGFIQ